MMVRFLSWLVELRMRISRKPWARFTISGISDESEVRFDVAYNKAFIKNLTDQGLAGASDEETVQHFLFGTFMAPKEIFEEAENVASDAHPFLQTDGNVLKQ